MITDLARRTALKRKYPEEQVLVVPYSELNKIPDKFTRVEHSPSIWSRFDHSGKFIFRYDAEENPTFQQIIPHVIVQHSDGKRFFVAKRLSGDQRLMDSISLGFGGHINPCDGTKDILFKSLFRELHEELNIEPIGSAEFIGYVRGLTTNTNDHLGCVFIVKAATCSIKETENLEGSWMTIKELEDNYFNFESWARYIIDYMVANKGII